jgi:hypothetical protein
VPKTRESGILAHAMVMQTKANWNLIWMGQAFVVATQQSGPRGVDRIQSANWGMLAAARNLGRGNLMLRGMVSLDPLTVTGKQYPLLFQSGETANGKPIVDGQHPHDLLMKVSIHYARSIGEKAIGRNGLRQTAPGRIAGGSGKTRLETGRRGSAQNPASWGLADGERR